MRSVCVTALLMLVFLPGCQRTEQRTTETITRPETPKPAAAAQTVTSELGEWYIKMTPESATAGDVTFDVRNTGKAPHALEIKGQGMDERSETIQGGESTSLTVNLKPGTYTIWCPVGNHDERGMHGEFRVSDAGATGD